MAIERLTRLVAASRTHRRVQLLGLVLSAAFATVAEGAAQTTFTHDANGNRTSKTENGVVWTYLYDAQNLLREVQRDGVLLESYQYDYQGHRIKKAGPEGVVRYLWDDDKILVITDDFGNTIAKYDYAGDRLLSVEHATEGTAYFLFDGLGSVVDLSKPDGSLAARYRYDAWGNRRTGTGQSSNPFLFTGYQLDEATGLYYAKARFYDPELGRFLTRDPVPGGIFEPQSLHPYLYAYGNPTVYLDPDGRCVGSLQQTELCQAIAKNIAFVIAGDPEARVESEIEIREKVVQGRRDFRQQTGRAPLPDEVVWSDEGRALTSNFREIDTSGRIEPDHAEWTVAGAGIGTRMAVNAARAGGATTAEQIVTGLTQLGDDAVGEATGASPGDVAGLGRLAKRGLSPRPPPGLSGGSDVVIVGEAADRLGANLVPRHAAGERSGQAAESAEYAARWVDEGGNLRAGKSPGMSAEAYTYQSATPGARSNPWTGRSQAPALDYVDVTGNPATVKFDGVEGAQLIDRKVAVHTGPKTRALARRQSEALAQKGLTGVWELPTASEAARAQQLLIEEGITNIAVRVTPR
jgi:RHS repeat-associated protein